MLGWLVAGVPVTNVNDQLINQSIDIRLMRGISKRKPTYICMR